MMYALVLAGGSGTRLWPYSRAGRPKQFLPLVGDTTMIQETVNRTLPIIPPERVFVATGAAYAELIAEQLPDVPRENLLIEPAGRGTAPCIGWAAHHLVRRDPEAVMAVLSADHLIQRADLFCQSLLVAEQIARQEYLVTLGIEPTMPSTGYGYIQRGECIAQEADIAAYAVQRFVEKPDAKHAQAYLDSGTYVWNAGMFVWRADRILGELATHRPALAQALSLIDVAIGTPHEQAVLEAVWQGIENVAIDVAVMEQTARATVIPIDLGWNDVGDWATLADTLNHDAQGNAVVGTHVGASTRNTLVYGNGRLIATIGVENLMIIDTDDVLLVCPRNRAQDVKAMVAQVRQQHEHLL